jgi:hypothetical protein
MGAAVGGAIPFSHTMPAGLIPAALAQAQPSLPRRPQRCAGRAKGRNISTSPARTASSSCSATSRWSRRRAESLLNDDTTPVEKFFVRNNGQIPEETKEPDKWKIVIDGEVNNKTRDRRSAN